MKPGLMSSILGVLHLRCLRDNHMYVSQEFRREVEGETMISKELAIGLGRGRGHW